VLSEVAERGGWLKGGVVDLLLRSVFQQSAELLDGQGDDGGEVEGRMGRLQEGGCALDRSL
jgi:hypothetical protein